MEAKQQIYIIMFRDPSNQSEEDEIEEKILDTSRDPEDDDPQDTDGPQDGASLFAREILKAQPLTVEAVAERQIYFKEFTIPGGSKALENVADQLDELAMAYFIAAKKIRKKARKDWPIHRFKVRILRDPIEVRIETPA